MTGNRLALVADDQRLASTIQQHLKKALGHASYACSFSDIRQHLHRDTDCLLLLAAGAPGESEGALRLIQEIYIQMLPPVLVILEADSLPIEKRLSMLDPYVARRFRWPDEAGSLTDLVQQRAARLRDAA